MKPATLAVVLAMVTAAAFAAPSTDQAREPCLKGVCMPSSLCDKEKGEKVAMCMMNGMMGSCCVTKPKASTPLSHNATTHVPGITTKGPLKPGQPASKTGPVVINNSSGSNSGKHSMHKPSVAGLPGRPTPPIIINGGKIVIENDPDPIHRKNGHSSPSKKPSIPGLPTTKGPSIPNREPIIPGILSNKPSNPGMSTHKPGIPGPSIPKDGPIIPGLPLPGPSIPKINATHVTTHKPSGPTTHKGPIVNGPWPAALPSTHHNEATKQTPHKPTPPHKVTPPHKPTPPHKATPPHWPTPPHKATPSHEPTHHNKVTPPHKPTPPHKATPPHEPNPPHKATPPHKPTPPHKATPPHWPTPPHKATPSHKPTHHNKVTPPHKPTPPHKATPPHKPIPPHKATPPHKPTPPHKATPPHRPTPPSPWKPIPNRKPVPPPSIPKPPVGPSKPKPTSASIPNINILPCRGQAAVNGKSDYLTEVAITISIKKNNTAGVYKVVPLKTKSMIVRVPCGIALEPAVSLEGIPESIIRGVDQITVGDNHPPKSSAVKAPCPNAKPKSPKKTSIILP